MGRYARFTAWVGFVSTPSDKWDELYNKIPAEEQEQLEAQEVSGNGLSLIQYCDDGTIGLGIIFFKQDELEKDITEWRLDELTANAIAAKGKLQALCYEWGISDTIKVYTQVDQV